MVIRIKYIDFIDNEFYLFDVHYHNNKPLCMSDIDRFSVFDMNSNILIRYSLFNRSSPRHDTDLFKKCIMHFCSIHRAYYNEME